MRSNAIVHIVITRIDDENFAWFNNWAGRDEDSTGLTLLPRRYPREVALLHPGTGPADDHFLPFKAPDATDAPLSDEQVAALEEILLTSFPGNLACCLALYGGYIDLDDLDGPQGFPHPHARWVIARLPYALFGAPLDETLFSSVEDRWGVWPHVELSFLWAADRSWFIASAPDLAFTVIGCEDQLAERLLATPALRPHEMTRHYFTL